MYKFIQLTSHFWLRKDQIQAIEYRDSETLELTFLKVFTEDSVYDFRNEEAKEAWKRLEKTMALV